MNKRDLLKINQGDPGIEHNLGWPPGTLACLRQAFASGRRRDEVWDLTQVPAGQKMAVSQAAAVFKRGGVVHGTETTVYRRAELHSAQRVDEVLADLTRLAHPLLVVDENVATKWPQVRSNAIHNPVWVFRGGEPAKDLASLGQLTSWIRSTRASSQAGRSLVAIGGGVTLDLAGFAAGLCGIDHVNIPTTLLAMVDAAVGGKAGVNFEDYGKNQVGLFHFPVRVILCPEFLDTLPVEEVRAGAAECLKHALLAGELDLFEKWATAAGNWSAGLSIDVNAIVAITRMKEAFVERDPFERSGTRELLNLGHTTAHALEALALAQGPDDVIRHGAAVAFGLACKTQLMATSQPEAAVVAGRVVAGLRASHCLDEVAVWFSRQDRNRDALWARVLEKMRSDKKLRSTDGESLRVIGLRWNSGADRIEPCSMEVAASQLRQAFDRAVDLLF